MKSAAHDVDIGKNSDDVRKLERQRAEDNQRQKQDMDAIYEELDEVGKIQRRLGCPIIDTTGLALEESATKVIDVVDRLCNKFRIVPHIGKNVNKT